MVIGYMLDIFKKVDKIHHNLKNIICYLFFGSLSYLVDLLSFLFLLKIIGLNLLIATVIAFIFGLSFSFLVNRTFVFRNQQNISHKSTRRQIILFALLVIINLIFTYLFLKLSISVGLHPAIGKTITTICTTLWNYVILKNVIFKSNN